MSLPDRLSCPCKINLYLKVVDRRPDGYHGLANCFLPLELPADTLELADSAVAGIELESSRELGALQDNLIFKAAACYAEFTGITPRWKFRLTKNIPVAAGLGGGSSDAAGTLILLNRCYGAMSKSQLAELAVTLGADVPFFLDPVPAWGTGIGEKLERLPGAEFRPAILLVCPGFPVSAKWAFTNLDLQLISPAEPQVRAKITELLASGGDWREFAGLCRNDLAPAIFKKFPLTAMLRDRLYASGALAAQISGSGPTLFAIFETQEAAVAAGKAIRESDLNTPVMRIFTRECEI